MEQIIQKFNFWDQAAIFSLKTSEIVLNQRQHVEKESSQNELILQIQNFDPCLFFFW